MYTTACTKSALGNFLATCLQWNKRLEVSTWNTEEAKAGVGGTLLCVCGWGGGLCVLSN
jgi:hypothetical protein